MLINEIQPSPYLAGYIRQYRIIDFYFPKVKVIPFKAYPPRPEHCLQFMLKDMETIKYPDSGICVSPAKTIFMGPHSHVIHRYPGNDMLALQVIFHPGVVYQLTNISANELANLYTNATDVFGADIHYITEQLSYAKSYAEIIRIVEDCLATVVNRINRRKHRVDDLCRLMSLENENFSLDRFLDEACLSHRQVDRKFKERIGLAPKQFLQMSRFDKAFRMKNRFPEMDWLSIALRCGYYDYQHLVKDYKEFTGYTPPQFFAIDSAAPERILGDVET